MARFTTGEHYHAPVRNGPAPPTAAAIANAVCDAIGVRLRNIPFTPDRVRAAVAAGS